MRHGALAGKTPGIREWDSERIAERVPLTFLTTARFETRFTAMRSDMEAQISDQVRGARGTLEQVFEARVARAVEAELERLTAPATVA
ncbi:hypothetical protein [Phaeospirillum tilakii]|uniref:Phasin protein n=1 Tax=Phaeospirillum tilakii TaxID=741673 RepID=A0ABW5CAW8_9PROT